MPLNAVGWTTEEDEQLITLVKPHPFLYDTQDPSRNNILARETSWIQIAKKVGKPVEECRKRWRGLRDGYMRRKRVGSKNTSGIIDRLQFLDHVGNNAEPEFEHVTVGSTEESNSELETHSEEVITDGYYEITLVETPENSSKQQPHMIKILPKNEPSNDQGGPDKPKRIKTGGRKRSIPISASNLTPVKILPKPIVITKFNSKLNNLPNTSISNLVSYPNVDEQHNIKPKQLSRSESMDVLIEKILTESTNEVDIFFRSMAASVKKLSPSLIPKIKMEVCNVIAKYEMQSFEKTNKQ